MQKDKLVSLRLIGFKDFERKNFESILTLAERGLQKKWQIIDSSDVDFFLLSLSAYSQLESEPSLKSLPKERCIYCSSKQITDDNSNVLIVDDKQVPSLRALVELFNRLDDKVVLDSLETVNDSIVKETETEFFDISEGFLGRLFNAEETLLKIVLPVKPELPALYIDMEANSYYSQNNFELLTEYVTSAIKELNVSFLTKNQLESIINSENLKPQKIKDLVWLSVIKNSQGRPMKGFLKNDIVKLKVWPDLRLPGCLEYAKLATFMKNNAVTLQTVAEKTQFPLEDVYTFYNACYMIGLIEKRPETELNPRAIDPQQLNLINKIGARLNQ